MHVQIKDSRGRRLDPEKVFVGAITPEEDNLTEDQKTALLMATLVERWEWYHNRKLDGREFDSIEQEARKIIRGQINFTDLLKRWSKGN